MASRTRRTVLVTGASTGIGRATARMLAGHGWYVFAGVRRESDAEALSAELGHLGEAVILDVTDADDIAEVADRIADGGPLDALVNNAGIAVAAPLEYLPLEEFRRQLEVNLTGQLAVTQAVLPALRQAPGRIVFIGSVGDRVAGPTLGPYHASKFGLVGMTDSLRAELVPAEIDVAVVEPGAIATEIWRRGSTAASNLVGRLPAEARRRYGPFLEASRRAAVAADERGLPPEAVARVILRALTVPRPKPRYLVGRDAWLGAAFAVLPSGVRARLMAARVRGQAKSSTRLSVAGVEDRGEGVPPGDLTAVRP